MTQRDVISVVLVDALEQKGASGCMSKLWVLNCTAAVLADMCRLTNSTSQKSGACRIDEVLQYMRKVTKEAHHRTVLSID